jgi:hypothetical protein
MLRSALVTRFFTSYVHVVVLHVDGCALGRLVTFVTR